MQSRVLLSGRHSCLLLLSLLLVKNAAASVVADAAVKGGGSAKCEKPVPRRFCDDVPSVMPKDTHWSYYNGSLGPDRWHERYPDCGCQHQSPVQISHNTAVGHPPWPDFMFENYHLTPSLMLLWNNGHTAQVTMEGDPWRPWVYGGALPGVYIFEQLHFHWSSNDEQHGAEEIVDNSIADAELHLVHFKADYGSYEVAAMYPDGVAVLAVLLERTYHPNPRLNNIIDGLARVQDVSERTCLEPFPLMELLPDVTNWFLRFHGSHTTPPCRESVIWTIFDDHINVSHEQLQWFRQLKDGHGGNIGNNFRPVQPLNGRLVFKGPVQ